MPKRPLLLFPTHDIADKRDRKPGGKSEVTIPPVDRQYTRLEPRFTFLSRAIEQKTVKCQQSPTGINPDLALVIETVGSAEKFYKAVKNIDGLEWVFDSDADSIRPDSDFYQVKKGKKSDALLSGKVYCVVSNEKALKQLLNLWSSYKDGNDKVFKRGMAGIRDIFRHIKEIRKWDARDRVNETGIMDSWRESLSGDGDDVISFEIELFFRNEENKRQKATSAVKEEIKKLNGHINQECIIQEICYHGLLVSLPRKAINQLVNKYEQISLAQVDDIMFFRPMCQAVYSTTLESERYLGGVPPESLTFNEPIVAVLDGMPIQNHPLLRGKTIIDDPDGYSERYQSGYRIHGTAMLSLVIYGDINKEDYPISSPVYMRPILLPRPTIDHSVEEFIPEDKLFVDVLHRAVKRIVEGDNGESAAAGSVKAINLSIGDGNRQLTSVMSPAARLLDFLSFKYKVLFVVSAGNHPEVVNYVKKSFDDFKKLNIEQRSKLFGEIVQNEQRNLRLLSPAEQLNGLTVGAIYNDSSLENERHATALAVERGLPAPYSAVGRGYRSTISPSLFYFGGRQVLRQTQIKSIGWIRGTRAPGCKVAAPYGTEYEGGVAYMSGTSCAAAQITHEAAKCHDVLRQVFDDDGRLMPNNLTALLLKAMVVHGASWEGVSDKLVKSMNIPSNKKSKLGQWLGYGVPDFERVVECTKERITVIGYGEIKKEEGHIFKLPIPVDFASKRMKRKLTVTLAYFSPISPNRQEYRKAELWFEVKEGAKLFNKRRQNTDWQAVRRGTLQHEIFIGDSPVVWEGGDIIIKVNCKEVAGKLTENIQYCLFVSFEVAEGLNIDLYSAISSRIRPRVKIDNG